MSCSAPLCSRGTGAIPEITTTDEQIACGRALIKAGRDAVAAGDPKSVLLADVAFHSWIYETSGNISEERWVKCSGEARWHIKSGMDMSPKRMRS
jgi:DNA-binding GntR family transcriptional regulator